jgi:Zn-dependent M28 family amino/carboxypeptidase
MRKLVALFIFLGSVLWLSCQTDTTSDSPLTLIDGKDFSRHVAVLSHDSLEGRMPFTNGETKTITYLADQFASLGLKPGNGDSFFQEVPLVEIESQPTGGLVVKGKGKPLTLTYLDDFVINSRRLTSRAQLQNSELIFAGYGIVAPEFDWNDYEGLDVKGKTVVVLVNDPGYADSTLFRGRNMTYYGRWTYKFEEASRQGAAGVLIVHEQGPASYGWTVVRNSWSGAKLNLQESGENARPTEVEGWISLEAATRLFETAGQPVDLLKKAASKDFKAVPLGVNASITVDNKIKKSVSHNVLGLLPGAQLPDEYIVYMAHWDHLGIGEPVEGDSIYNGAVDNATGVAAILEIAKAFTQSSVKPARSILFLAVTAEEQGLLGSAYYATHPVYPAAKTLAAINIDAMAPFGRTKDVIVVGKGQSELDDYVEASAKKQGRYLRGEKNPSGGTYYRSDHFNFAKIGVPALYSNSGVDLWNGGKEAGEARHAEYGQKKYHSPLDNYSQDWDISGIIEDMQLLYDVGVQVSNTTEFPKWKSGSEFKEIREKIN